MGISGLLHGIKSVATTKNCNGSEMMAGKCIAVDTSSWLHKSVYSIADHFVETTERGKPDNRCISVSVSYIRKRCEELLRHAKVQKIFLVMDGERCPLKAVTNQDREAKRQENLQQARSYRKCGDKTKMFDKYKACIKIRNDLAFIVAQKTRQHFSSSKEVAIVWSPYEADAQLVKLAVDGHVQAIVTEDSDVLVYCATANVAHVPVLTKLDRHTLTCDATCMKWLLEPTSSSAANTIPKKKNASSGLEPYLQAFATRQMRNAGAGVRLFVQACVLAGCDYSPNQLSGFGIVSSFREVRNSVYRPPEQRFHYILQQKSFQNKAGSHNQQDTTEGDYETLLTKSEAVFYYHPVRDIQTGRIVNLTDHPDVDEADGVQQQRPNLQQRFGSDWTSFLGSLTEKKPLLNSSKVPENFGSGWISTKSSSKGPWRKRGIADVANPYTKNNCNSKRSHKDGTMDIRSIFKPRSPNVGENTRKRQKDEPVQSAFVAQVRDSFGKGKSKSDLWNRYYGGNNNGGLDVRFAKRVFNKDGTRCQVSSLFPCATFRPVLLMFFFRILLQKSSQSRHERPREWRKLLLLHQFVTIF